MKKNIKLTLLAGVSALYIASNACAATLLFDDFGLETDPVSNLNGRTPVTGPSNWSGFSGGINTGWKISGGEALLGSASGNSMAGISFGDDYFSSNPAIYSLSANMEMESSSSQQSWYAIGFNEVFATSTNTGFYNPNEVEGQPWMFVRSNGDLQVRYNEDDFMFSGSGFDVTDIELELVLDTSVAQWTVDAYVNGVQLDLNGAAIGNSFTYTTNPSDIASVGFSATSGVVGTIQDIKLQTVPEPQAFALIAGLGGLCLVLARRRR